MRRFKTLPVPFADAGVKRILSKIIRSKKVSGRNSFQLSSLVSVSLWYKKDEHKQDIKTLETYFGTLNRNMV